MAVKDIILQVLKDARASNEGDAIQDTDLIEHCKSHGLSDVDTIETELHALIDSDVVEYTDTPDGALVFWLM